MSYNACGFSYTPPSQLLMTGQHASLPYTTVPGSMPPETLVSQVSSGTTMCYDGRFFAYPRLSVGDLYGPGYPEQAAAAAAAAGYMAGLTPSSAVLYPSSLTSPYDLKDSRAVWTALPQAAGYPCDSTISPYGPYGDRFDPVDSEARRRNATRETTSTLKAWLNEHRKNPYPTKGEKIMLAIITKMTLTQVSTWFANARRRLKKENKMTWEPRNKTGDDLDDVSVDEDDEKVDEDAEDQKDDAEVHSEEDRTADSQSTPKKGADTDSNVSKEHSKRQSSPAPGQSTPSSSPALRDDSREEKVNTSSEDITDLHQTKDSPRLSSEKPKIWSLAQTATSQSPPPVRRPNFFETLSASNVSNEERLRMSRLFFQRDPRVVSSDISGCSPLHRDLVDIRSRNIQDSSSTESSLSSPPLWRGNETHNLSGLSVNAFDTVSGASSASCSPSLMNASPADASTSGIPVSLSSFGYSPAAARFFNCTRFLPTPTDISSVRSDSHPNIERFVPQSHLGQSLDLRTLHTQFFRPPLGYPMNFSALTHHAETAANRTKATSPAVGEETRSNS